MCYRRLAVKMYANGYKLRYNIVNIFVSQNIHPLHQLPKYVNSCFWKKLLSIQHNYNLIEKVKLALYNNFSSIPTDILRRDYVGVR